jgi:hypothetical protein
MTQDNPPENNTNKPKGRLDNPVLRLASVFVAIIAICTLLYSFASSLPIIPIMAGIFFLMLWFIPQFWKWIEFVFSKRPSSAWGRFTLNLVLAIIMASAFEDVLEIIMKFARIAFWMLRRVL